MRLDSIQALSNKHKAALRTGNILDVDTLLLCAPTDVARKCRISPAEAENIVKTVCRAIPAAPTSTLAALLDADEVPDAVFTTGDETLDEALGGGFRTGMVWEVCGESAAGKTQLALQLSLTVQLPSSLGGLSGSTCYLTTRRTLPTERLLQIAHSHPLLAGAFPGTSALTHIHTRAAPDAAQLLYALTTALPLLLSHLHETGQPPLRLVVLDTLAEVFHDAARTSTHSLVQRAQTLNRAGAALHALARTHGLAALVLNEVSDVFADYAPSEPGEFVYREHARWFARAEGGPMLPGVERKEAALGLAWANQPNVRVMLSRTDRRRYVDLVEAPAAKRRRVDGVQDGGEGESGLTLVRRLSVIFSSVGPQAALDYVVTEAGVVALPLEEDLPAVDADARSDAYSDFGGVEDEDLLSALAEAEGRSANATDVTPATSDAPDASGMLVAPGLDAQEEIALEQSEALLEEDLVAEADVTVDEEVPTAVDEDGPDDMPSEDHGLG